jgi:hypothetical protein
MFLRWVPSPTPFKYRSEHSKKAVKSVGVKSIARIGVKT